MTAEERMRSLLADVLDAMHESALRDEGRNAIHRCDIEAAMKMLALEGEQGNPTKDQRGAAATAACLSEEAVAGSEKGKSPLTEFPEQDAAAPHHHLAGKFEWVEIGFSAQLDAELALHHHSRTEQQAEASGHLANARDAQVSAPAREPSAEVTARNVADGAESADLLTPSRVRAMAIAFDRLRAENAELRAECAVRNDEVSGLIGMNADLRAKLAVAEKEPTEQEISLYRDMFRAELNRRMDLSHPSTSPSTESHGVALRQFVRGRIAASQEPKHG